MNQSLRELLNTIKEKEAESRVVTEDIDPRIRASAEAIKRAADRDLIPLRENYRNQVMSTSVIIAVSGPGSAAFAQIAADKFKMPATVNYTGIVDELVGNLKKRGAKDLYDQHTHMMLWDEINKCRIKYGFIRLPQPNAPYPGNVFDRPLEEAVRNLFEINYRSSLYAAVTRCEAGLRALEIEFDGKRFPVVVYNYTGENDTSFLPEPVKTINALADVTEDFVKKSLEEVKQLFSKSASKKKKPATEAEEQEKV